MFGRTRGRCGLGSRRSSCKLDASSVVALEDGAPDSGKAKLLGCLSSVEAGDKTEILASSLRHHNNRIEDADACDALLQLGDFRVIELAPLANDDYLLNRDDYCSVVFNSRLSLAKAG